MVQSSRSLLIKRLQALIVCTLVSPFWAQAKFSAETSTLEDCEATLTDLPDHSLKLVLEGKRLFSKDAESFALDNTTIANLELNDLVLKPVLDQAPTELGRARLKYLFSHPYTNYKHILERQAAVGELMQNMEFTRSVHSELSKLTERNDQCWKETDEALDSKRSNKTSMSNAIHGTALFATCGLMGAGAAAAAIGLGEPRFGIFAFKLYLMPTVTSYVNGKDETGIQAKKLFGATEVINKAFPKFQSIELRRISEILGWPWAKGDPLGLGTVRKAFERIGAEQVRLAIQSGTFSRLIVRTVGWRTLQRMEKNLAVYLSAMAEFEAYVAAANFLDTKRDQLTVPLFVDSNDAFVEILKGHHPYQAFTPEQTSIANNLSLRMQIADDGTKTYLLTGPNAGGKTTYLRMVAQLILLAQMGFPVPAEAMTLTPTKLITNFHVVDSTQRGHSTFMSQSRRISEIMDVANKDGRPVFAAFDEILTGTSADEHWAAEQAVIEALHATPNLLTITATHDRTHTALEGKLPGLRNIHVTLDGFKIDKGPSIDYNAFDVMDRAGVKRSITDRARELLRQRMESRHFGSRPR